MNKNRINISTDCYLLFAEILYYCITPNIKHEELNKKLLTLSEKVKTKAPTKKGDYLKGLASNFHKPKTIYSTIYGVITTRIKSDKKKKEISLNMNSSLGEVFKKIEAIYPNVSKKGVRYFFENTLGTYFPIEKTKAKQTNEVDNKASTKDDFLDTTWFLYYHEYLDKPKTPYTVISRLVLHIKDKENIKLFERKENEDFVGNANFIHNDTNSSILIINLERESTSFKKKLELRIIKSGGISDNSVYLGQYMDTETGDKIVSGTFVLENVKGHDLGENSSNSYLEKSKYTIIRKVPLQMGKPLEVIQTDLVYYSDWERYIPKAIAKYLSHKWKNHSKTKPVATTLAELGDWLREQRELKPFEEYKFNTNIEYDLFVVTPVGNIKDISEKQYYKQINNYFFEIPNPAVSQRAEAELPDPIYDSKKIFKKIGINKIYYSPRILKLQNPSFSGDEETHTIIDNDLKAMRKSRFVIFIMPEQLFSSALIKIGWAMQQEKPIIVFPLKQNVLPKLLTKPYEKKIWVSDPMKIKDIPEKLITDYQRVLKW